MPRAVHVGYAGPVQAVRDAFADPEIAAVYVVGPAGSGKSFLLGRLASEREADAVPSVDRVDLLEPVDRPLASFLTFSDLAPEGRPRILAIDDVDQLDESSIALLGRAVDQHRIRLLATMRSRAACGLLGRLRIAGESLVVSIPPWQRSDLDAFVERRLGGRMHALTAARLLEFSGGNALCVTELVDVASATGSLRREHDVWFSEEGPWVPPVTAARIASDLPRVSDAGRDVIDTAAVVGSATVADLEQTYGAAAVEEADEAGALQVGEHDGRLTVRLLSPIEARVIAQRMSTTRRLRLHKAISVARASADVSAAQAVASSRVTGPAAHLVRLLITAGPGRALEVAATIDSRALQPQQQAAVAAVVGWAQLFYGALGRAGEHAELLQVRGTEQDDPHSYQMGALLEGRSRLATGDAVGARAALSEVVVLRTDPVSAATARYALPSLAMAYAMTGHDLDAVRTLDAAGIGPVGGPFGFRTGLDQLTRAELLLENGLHHAAAERAAAVAARCSATGQALLAVQALHLCVRARPVPSVADDLRELADRLDYGLVRTYWRHAVAAVAGDAAAMADVAAEYDGLGFRRLAGETAARALSLVEGRPTAPWAAASRLVLHQVRSDPRVTVPAWWWHEDVRSVVLTQREREIAELAARGASSPEIAARLQLSRRTIENHLQHVYRKLGIVRRDQLPDVLRLPTMAAHRTAGAAGG